MTIVYGTNGDDTLAPSDGVRRGNDFIYGFGGADDLFGGFGDDYLAGGEGADDLYGGFGIDTASYFDSAAGVTVSLLSGTGFGGTAQGDRLIDIENLTGSEYSDVLVGDGDANELKGFGGNDTLVGGAGADRLLGGNGHDLLKGGGGADLLAGGHGSDTAAYTDSDAGVVISLLANTAMYGDAEGDSFISVENLTGSAYDDILSGDDNANVFAGLDDADALHGNGGNDTLWGGAGDDWLYGGAGGDAMIGGAGDDHYHVDHWSDAVTESGGQGQDEVLTSVSYALANGVDVETLRTTDDNGTTPLVLVGSSSGNQIIGNAGDNIIKGGGGTDALIGRAGNDTYYVDSEDDWVAESGGQGQDEVRTSVHWHITEGADVETLSTINDSDTAEIDLSGNSTGNVVRGNNGNNGIDGGAGNDELIGLGGHDNFVFSTALDAATNVDVVTDFNVADDTIVLDHPIFSSSLGGGNISPGDLVIGTSALDANDHIIYDSNSGALFYDSDGNGATAQVQFAQLSAGLALTNLDFFVL